MGSATMSSRKQKLNEKAAAKAAKSGAWSATTVSKHELYQLAVQNVEAEIDFIDAEFERLRGRKAVLLREDFCGTGNSSTEWIRRRSTNRAIGLDIDQPTLDWGVEHHVEPLSADQQARIQLINRDVLEPGDASGADCVLAMNFSYWLFKTRDELRAYFRAVHESIGEDGVFFLDHYGGSESMAEQEEEKEIDEGPGKRFVYVWDQHKYNPITGEMVARIHFKFPDKTKIKTAFEYHWRLWTLPELRELLHEAGFKNVNVYWEGEDEDGEGDGVYTPTLEGAADPAFICYISAFD
ncbi:MAG: class I SAM-dependent methyltransferase [Phycisphaerales bacterium]|nr:class I SAM-dependent methyltransferase [Phycisphaerales bacterium]